MSIYSGNGAPFGVGVLGYATDENSDNAGVVGVSESHTGVGGLFIAGKKDGQALIAEDAQDNNFFVATGKGDVSIGVPVPGPGLARLTVRGKDPFFPFPSTIETAGSSTTITGTGTQFLSELAVGDRINAAMQNGIITGIASDTELTVSNNMNISSGSGFQVFPAIFRLDGSGGNSPLLFTDQGNLQLGAYTNAPARLVVSHGMLAGNMLPSTSHGGGLLIRSGPGITEGATIGGFLAFGGNRGTTKGSGNFAAIKGAKENGTDDDENGYLGFWTTTPGLISEKMRVSSEGNLGVGTITPGQKVEVNGGVRLNTATAKPTCDASVRGTFWVVQGGAGVADAVEVCSKDSGDAYAWRTLL